MTGLLNGKLVFIDVSGLAHKASKKDPATVVREGTSRAQQDYMRGKAQTRSYSYQTLIL